MMRRWWRSERGNGARRDEERCGAARRGSEVQLLRPLWISHEDERGWHGVMCLRRRPHLLIARSRRQHGDRAKPSRCAISYTPIHTPAWTSHRYASCVANTSASVLTAFGTTVRDIKPHTRHAGRTIFRWASAPVDPPDTVLVLEQYVG
jgi:hypothetical protein